ncbi:MAG: hypothetical protein K2I80_00185, partial [Ruminococcus sp.]|nr:hypothetical protein [Ruminococcus sp.]
FNMYIIAKQAKFYNENAMKLKEYFLYLQSEIFQFLDFLIKDIFGNEINFQCKKYSEKCYEILYEMTSVINKIDYYII